MADFSTPYATRLCLSGVESRRLLDTFKNFGVKHIQVSYYYLRKVFSGDLTEWEQYARNFHTVIIDSGTVYGGIKNEDQKKELIQEYAAFLSAIDKHSYTAAVYEDGVGLDKIVPDESLIYPLDAVRDVFDNDLRSVFTNLRYVGVSNKECMADGGDQLIPIFAQASKSGSLVHAFGTGSKKILSKYPFYSANSSSWRSGSRYLNTYIYEGPSRGLRLYQPTDKKDPVKTQKEIKAIRRRQANLVKIKSPDIYSQIEWDEAFEGDSWEVDKGNLAQWMLYATDLENLPHNKYFLTDVQRIDINLRKQALYAPQPQQMDERHEAEEGTSSSDSGSEGEHEQERASDLELPDERNQEHDYIDGDIVEEETSITPVVYDPLAALESEKRNVPAKKTERAAPVDERMRTVRNCDFCILQGRCPKYEPGAPCSYGLDPENPSYDVDNLDGHIITDGADLLAIQKDRIMQLFLEEKMDASGANKDLTNNLKLYMEMVALFREATDNRDTVEFKAKGTGIMDMFKKGK